MRIQTRRVLTAVTFVVVLVAALAVAANANRRHLDEYSAPQGESTQDVGPGLVDDDSFTPEELAEAERLGRLEAELTASNMPGALYDKTVDGLGPSADGLSLESALTVVGPSRLDSMRIIDVQTDSTGGVSFEQVMYGDGSRTGYIMVYWQHLFGDEDTSEMVGPFGEIKNEGQFDIITDVRDDVGMSLRLVRVFDGTKILSIQANDIAGLEIDELIPLAKELFGLLPA